METPQIKREWIYWIVISILAFVVFRSCNSTDKPVGIITHTKEYIKGKSDTIFIPSTPRVITHILPSDTVYTSIDSATGKTFNNYKTIINDSLISGEVISTVNGKLIFTDFKYIPKFPKYITRVDTLKLTTETIKANNPWEVSIGAELGAGSTSIVFQPSILIRTPMNISIIGGYDLINKTYNIGAFQRITWFDKKK
jgi:hypothetical protein